MMKKKMWLALSLLAVLVLSLGGCGQRITAEEIVDHVQETVANTEAAHAVVSASVSAQGIEMSATAEVWEKAPSKLRAEVLETSQAEYDGAVLVTDGQQAWYYNASENRVLVGPVDEIETPLPQQLIVEMQDMIQVVLDASDVELAGEETVAGHQAYKLILTPKETGEEEATIFPGNGTATLWVDKEQWFVLKAAYEAGSFGQGSMEVQSFELNPGLSDDLFVFDIPEGVTVVDVESQQAIPLTLEEARAQADFPLLVPTYLPRRATLVEVFKIGGSIILRYDHSPDVSFTVVQGSDVAGPPAAGESQRLTIRGQAASAMIDEVGGNTVLYWIEDGLFFTVAGHLSLEEALQVAESLQ